MKAFEVLINGHFVCRAGIGDDGVLTTIVHWIGSKDGPDDTFLTVGGLDTSTNEHVDWMMPTIGVGTEITLRVVEVDTVEPPSTRKLAKRKDEPNESDTRGMM